MPDSHRNRATVVFLCHDVAHPECEMKTVVKNPITIFSNKLLGSSLSINRRTAKEMLKIMSKKSFQVKGKDSCEPEWIVKLV